MPIWRASSRLTSKASCSHISSTNGRWPMRAAVTHTNELTPNEVVKRYKSLADIERDFRVLKSEIEIGPIHHRLPERIRRA